MKKIETYYFKSESFLFDKLLQHLSLVVTQSSKEKIAIALSGGNTAKKFYKNWTQKKELYDFLWEKLYIFFADERMVPFEGEHSNYKLARDFLLKNVSIPEKNIFPIQGSKGKEAAVRSYIKTLSEFFLLKKNEAPVFDLIILGIGTDGHTASLFPADIEKIVSADSIVLPVSAPDFIPRISRVSLSLKTINAAQNVIFVLPGKEKQEIAEKVIFDIERSQHKCYPASHVKPQGSLFFYLSTD